jgi:hypothetical protein
MREDLNPIQTQVRKRRKKCANAKPFMGNGTNPRDVAETIIPLNPKAERKRQLFRQKEQQMKSFSIPITAESSF